MHEDWTLDFTVYRGSCFCVCHHVCSAKRIGLKSTCWLSVGVLALEVGFGQGLANRPFLRHIIMAAVERRHGGTSSDEEHCGYRRTRDFDDEWKKGKRNGSFCVRLCQLFVPGFMAELKLDPVRALKRFLCKVVFYLWCLTVVISILSLLGFKVNPFVHYKRSTTAIASDVKLGDNALAAGASSDGSLWNVFGDVFSGEEDKAEMGDGDGEENKESEEEAIPQQVIASPVKEGNKVNKKLERKLACEEVTCIDACNKKIKPKCAKSRNCRNDRDKICHRRCRKARCEDRCKDEPKFGYVEREQRMDKCKEDCSGPTAVHNKCIKRCHSQFKPCKSRCHEIAHKFQCDSAQPMKPAAPVTAEPEPRTRAPKKNSKNVALLEDPEMI